jgi:hypothetical protein
MHSLLEPNTLLFDGKDIMCMACSATWSRDPKPQWPKVFVSSVHLKHITQHQKFHPGFGVEMCKHGSQAEIEYSVDANGKWEILSVNGRKLEDG